jgi:predicted AlkP superfamily phosphohydrolase/phosphomutase
MDGKVCVVGLDGATWDLLDPWMEDLPTIRSFADRRKYRLESCRPPISVPAWKCYTTGMDPGDLGVFTFVDPDFEDETFRTVRNDTFTHREVFDYLGEAGHRSAAVNIPSSYPPREIDGWMVSGPFSEPDDFARPREFQERLRERGYTIIPEYYLSRDPADLDPAVESVRDKFDVCLSVADDVDFLHVTVYVTDTVQHTEWNSPASKSFWEAVDRELGRFLSELGEGWNVLLMSDHGFGPTEGVFYLNTFLEREGYMRLDDSSFDVGDLAGMLGMDYATATSVVRRLGIEGVLRSFLPGDLLLRVARQMPGNRKLEGVQDKIDWSSPAVALAPLVYTKTRAVAEDIREDLLSLTDRDGDPVVETVHFGADLYPDATVRVPDLIIGHTEYVISDVLHDGDVLVYDGNWAEGKVAHHRQEGIFTARGPDVRDVDLDTPRLVDLTPTVLDGFGIDVPEAMRGESLGLLGSNGRRRDLSVDRDADRVVAHDEAVEQKLKDLGYL